MTPTTPTKEGSEVTALETLVHAIGLGLGDRTIGHRTAQGLARGTTHRAIQLSPLDAQSRRQLIEKATDQGRLTGRRLGFGLGARHSATANQPHPKTNNHAEGQGPSNNYLHTNRSPSHC